MARAEKKIHYLYKTTCIITGRWYIGMHSTNNLNDGYMGSGKRLRRSIRKHGIENHTKEILEFFENRDLLLEGEKKTITEDMVLDNNCMNLMGGGKGGYVSEEHYQKTSKIGGKIHSDRMKNDKEYREKNLKLLAEYREKNINEGNMHIPSFSGLTHSDNTKRILSKKKEGYGLGDKNTQYGTCWVTKEKINKKIKKEELELFISDGWVKGRLMTMMN